MSPEFLQEIRQSYFLYLKYGIKLAKPSKPAELISKEPVNIELKQKIIATLESTFKCCFPTGLLYPFRFFRFYLNSNQKIQCYYFNQEKLQCIPLKNPEAYLLAYMQLHPEENKVFDEFYEHSLKTGSDLITWDRSFHKITLTKSHLIKRIWKYVLEMKSPEFRIDDSNIISSYASYWMAFKRDYFIFSDNLPVKPDYRMFPHEVEEAFKAYCIENNHSYVLGLPKLKKALKDYKGSVRMPFLTPTGRKTTKPIKAYKGIKLKNPPKVT